ncbi:MAG: SDR family NAD(P)-dependent oxidoreductase [Proteobacteria bacterium]|nr:SDR family NAD(P)-dependent oxidoreductase [Pseudomonadota bacterium]
MLTILVTGATDGIGLATARSLAGMGHHVLMHGRSADKGRVAVEAVRAAAAGKGEVRFLQADFASLAQVRKLAADLQSLPRLDVLINNAGCINLSRRVTADGLEMTFAVNHLAPFLLTNLLLEKLRASAPARIVTVASGAHRGQAIDFDDLMSTNDYRMMRTYGRSKLANILFTQTLAKRLAGIGVTANSLHPGIVSTHLGQDNWLARTIGRVFMAVAGVSADKGAKTSVYLATATEVAGTSGEYFAKCRPAPLEGAPGAVTDETAEHLWSVSKTLVGLT